MAERIVIALDGHDGVGKTTLAFALADRLGGTHIRPFAGEVGAELVEAASKKDYQRTLSIGHQAIERALANNTNDILICDRHWMTVLSLLPRHLWQEWQHFPPTTLCWADLEITRQRLSERSEETFSASYHRRYLGIYMKIAMEFGCHILRTDQCTLDEAINALHMRYAN